VNVSETPLCAREHKSGNSATDHMLSLYAVEKSGIRRKCDAIDVKNVTANKECTDKGCKCTTHLCNLQPATPATSSMMSRSLALAIMIAAMTSLIIY